MTMPTKEENLLQKMDDAIADFASVVSRHPRSSDPKEGYSEAVYEAASKACKALDEVYNGKLTNIEEYNAEIERLRQIGSTIDPATAETAVWYADYFDPYDICDPKFNPPQSDWGPERFARHRGASNRDWVNFCDLPQATRDALEERGFS